MAVDAMTLQQKFVMDDEDKRTVRIFWVVFLIEIAMGISLHFIEPSDTTSDFFAKVAPERVAKLVVAKKVETVVEDISNTGSSGTAKKKRKSSGGSKGAKKSGGGGGGDPRAKVTAKGVLGIISGKVEGAMGGMMANSILGAGGMAEDIDAVIGSIGGLKIGGKKGSGRKGKAGIGYGDGYGAGFGGGGGGTLDDLIGGLGGADALSSINLKKRGNVKITTGLSSIAEGSTGERDMDEIRAVVMERIGGVKYAYNSMLKTQPGLRGKITIEFTIGASGKITKVRVLSSNMNSPALEQKITRIIRRWTFRPIDSGDVKVVYPFIFAPGS